MDKKAAAFELGIAQALEDALKLGVDYSTAASAPSPYAKQIEQQGSWTRGGATTASPTPQSQTTEQPAPTTPLRETAGLQPPPTNTAAQGMQRNLRSQAVAEGNRYAKGWYGWDSYGR